MAAQAVRPNHAEVSSQKQQQFERARDSSNMVVAPNVSCANEIICFAWGFRMLKKQWFLEELKGVLISAGQDLNFAPIDHDPRDFVEVDEDSNFDEQMARAFVEHFRDRWPEVNDLSPDRVMILRKGMVAAE